jgi:hypothetical protein
MNPQPTLAAADSAANIGPHAPERVDTRLRGIILLLARAVWAAVVLLALGLFGAGIPYRIGELHQQYQGAIPVDLHLNHAGQLVLSPWYGEAAAQVGILQGDILVAIDGAPPHVRPGIPLSEVLAAGAAGDRVTLSVRTGDRPVRHYTIARGTSGGRMLAQLGLSEGFIVAYSIVVDVVFALVVAVSSAMIFWRKSDNWMALLVSLTLVVIFVGVSNPIIALYQLQPIWRAGIDAWFFFAMGCVCVFFYLFPTGRFMPRWTAVLIGILAAWLAGALFYPPLYPWRMNQLAYAFVVLGWLSTGVFAQVYRYRQSSDVIQRQQTKWVVFGAAAAALGLLAMAATVIWSGQSGVTTLLYDLAIYPISRLFEVFLPLSIGFAILRYHLFDIDLIIRRTLIYGTLTVAVVGVYALVVGGMSVLLQTRSDLLFSAVALGLIGLLFRPMRRRLESGVSRLVPVAPPLAVEAQMISPAPVPAGGQVAPPMQEDHNPTPLVPDEPPGTRLRDRWLVLARITWLALALPTVGIFFASVPLYFAYLQTACPAPVCANESLTSDALLALQAFGLSRGFLTAYVVALDVVFAVVYIAVAALIFWRTSADRMALFVALALLTFGTATFPFAMTTLAAQHPAWGPPVAILNFVGAAGFSLFLYVFPDGRFVPRWTRWVALAWIAWQLAKYWLPGSDLNSWIAGLNLIVWLGGLGTVIYSQVYRYRRVSSVVQRQQTKWVIFGITAALVGYLGISLALAVVPSSTSAGALLMRLVGFTITYLAMLLIPLSIGVAILRYSLFDIDVIIRRTLIYGALFGGLALAYFGSVALFQVLSQALTGPQSNLVIVATTLAIAALFNPLRRRVQAFVDRRFYREKVDFRQAFTTFAREVRTVIELPALLRLLVERTTNLLHIAHGAVFLRGDDGTFALAEARNLPAGVERLPADHEQLERLQDGQTVARPKDSAFPLLIPLIAPSSQAESGKQKAENGKRKAEILVGVLALGPRMSDQRYTRDDESLLLGLADQAGTAVYVAQLIAAQQAEAQRRAESERELEARRSSPIGRAEAAAQALLADPAALAELHRLVDQAGQDPQAARLLEHLPRALGALDHPRAPLLTGLADGFNYVFASQFQPELLAVGLRALISHLELATDDGRPTTDDQRPTTNELSPCHPLTW